MPTKAELQQQLDEVTAERPGVSTYVAAPVMVVGALLMIAVLWLAAGQLGGISPDSSPFVLAVPAIVGGGVCALAAHRHLRCNPFGTGPREVGYALSGIGSLGAAGWLVWTGYVGPAATWLHLIIGAVTLTLAWWALMWWQSRDVAEPVPAVSTSGDAVTHELPWQRMFDRADGRVTVTGVEYHRAGARVTLEPATVVVDAETGERDDVDVTFDEVANSADKFELIAAREYRRLTNERMPINSIRPEIGRDAAEFVYHVTMRDVFTADTPFVPAPGPQDITLPKDLGEFEDASRIAIDLLSAHMKIVGMTGSGKSVLANNLIARITECSNAEAWVCATDKLIPLIFPWLRPWFEGKTTRPTLAYVAGKSPKRVLQMLADVYRLCCQRNDRLADESKMKATQRERAVFVFVEETSHAVEFDDTIETFDGQVVGITDLIAMIGRAGRSANVRLILLTQIALNSAFGDAAPEINRHLGIRFCLKTMESHDGYRTIPALKNVDTTQLRGHTLLCQPSVEIARAMPGKAAAIDGTAGVYDIAVRNSAYASDGVEPESPLSDQYVNRWDPRLLPELAAAVEANGLSWRVPNGKPRPAPKVGDTQPLPVTPAPKPSTPVAPQIGPLAIEPGPDDHIEITDEGEAVDTREAWTDADDDKVARLLAGDETPERRPFKLPDAASGIARLKAIASTIGTDGDRPDDAAVVAEPGPLPPLLGRVIAWLDEQDEPASFYLSATIADGIGYDPARLGRDLYRETKAQTRTAEVAEDPRRRRGYDVSTLREVATRFRFGL